MAYTLSAKAALQINKPLSEVFEAVVNPEIMCNYFIAKGSGRMETAAVLFWSFPEFEGSFPLTVTEVVPDERIVFYWGAEDQKEVTITFGLYKDATVVHVTEGSENLTDKNLDWAIGNTEGWTSFLLCMKAWMEYGVNLRKGAYVYRFDEAFGK